MYEAHDLEEANCLFITQSAHHVSSTMPDLMWRGGKIEIILFFFFEL